MAYINLDNYSNILNSYLKAFNNSALTAELQSTREANAFSANQAALNRVFQQTSAEKAMKFEAEQARLLRDWNANQADIDRAFQQSSADKQMAFQQSALEQQMAFEQASADKQMAFQDASVQKQMDFQQAMANTVYQRAVQDLKAAGLSPLLAYSNLQTSAPSGASASGASASGSTASGSSAAGALPSGSSARGISASGSLASAFKGNYSSAKQADLKAFSEAISNIVFGVASAREAAKALDESGAGKSIMSAVSSVKDSVVNSLKKFASVYHH